MWFPNVARGVVPGLVMIVAGIILGPLICTVGEDPRIGRFVVAGLVGVGVIVYTLGSAYDDTPIHFWKRTDFERLTPLFAGFGALSIPLYFLLDALAVPFWIRGATATIQFVAGVISAVGFYKAAQRRQQRLADVR